MIALKLKSGEFFKILLQCFMFRFDSFDRSKRANYLLNKVIMKTIKDIDYSVTFACYNAIEYTKKCIDSMIKNGDDLSRLAIVDNGSTDGTQEYLQSLPLGDLILNKSNLGCGVAWNQGAMSLQSEWTIIMNNDVVVSSGWIENLINAAEKHDIKVISPSLIEGELDYDFDALVNDAIPSIGNYLRFGGKHAVCLAVHSSVWSDVGYFMAVPALLGYEDTLFFNSLREKGIKTAITGGSWLHHYGSITQSVMKRERGLADKDSLANRYNSDLLKQSWLFRKYNKFQKKYQEKKSLKYEIKSFKMSVHGVRVNGETKWFALF